MLEESLKEELHIPTIGGTLIAEFGFKADVWARARRAEHFDLETFSWKGEHELYGKCADTSLPENYEFRWRVWFWFAGPDRRYNGAGVSISESCLPELIRDFESALGIIQQLGTAKFSGTYRKVIGTSTNPDLQVVGSNGNFGVEFSMANNIRRLLKTISADNLPRAIAGLRHALVRGPELLDALRSVTQRTL